MRDSGDLGLLVQRVPRTATREGRILLLAEVFEGLLAGRLPSREAALFVGGAGSAWLQHGRDLVRDYFRVAARRGSHHRPEVLYRRLIIADERQEDAGRDTFGPSDSEA